MPSRNPIVFCADDYGLSAGVSQGILELARMGHISAFSAIVTLPRWAGDAGAVASVRATTSVGLHLNLTLGQPLTRMRRLAPDGRLPSVRNLVTEALARRVDAEEIAEEVRAQIEAFRAATGVLPDHVDGHQHVHALPVVRNGFLKAIVEAYDGFLPLVRDPADTISRISSRRTSMPKAFAIAGLAAGFGAAARTKGFPTNDGFTGFSSFDVRRPYLEEIDNALAVRGPRQMVMCHPGIPDAELAALDPVVERRGQEQVAIASATSLIGQLWTIVRRGETGLVDWARWNPEQADEA